MEEYKDHEYCEDKKCRWFYKPGRICSSTGCDFSAKDFHKWLKLSGYKIVKGGLNMKFKDKVQEAKFEAERFLKRVKEWEDVQHENTRQWETPKQCGAVKRASMDLTRSLANLRRS